MPEFLVESKNELCQRKALSGVSICVHCGGKGVKESGAHGQWAF